MSLVKTAALSNNEIADYFAKQKETRLVHPGVGTVLGGGVGVGAGALLGKALGGGAGAIIGGALGGFAGMVGGTHIAARANQRRFRAAYPDQVAAMDHYRETALEELMDRHDREYIVPLDQAAAAAGHTTMPSVAAGRGMAIGGALGTVAGVLGTAATGVPAFIPLGIATGVALGGQRGAHARRMLEVQNPILAEKSRQFDEEWANLERAGVL